MFLKYNSPTIDARILHEIYNNTKHKVIFVCAGGRHIDNINKILPKLGFEYIPTLEKHIKINFNYIAPIKKYFEYFYGITSG